MNLLSQVYYRQLFCVSNSPFRVWVRESVSKVVRFAVESRFYFSSYFTLLRV
jgi:hypothetical protein